MVWVLFDCKFEGIPKSVFNEPTFLFLNFFCTSDVLWVKCKKVYVDVLAIFGHISALNDFSAKQKKLL